MGEVLIQNGLSADNVQSAYKVPLNTWTHLVVVMYAGGVDLYVNGTYQETMPAIGLGTHAASTLRIGAVPFDGNNFLGGLDDVRIYNRALSAAEIAALAGVDPLPDGIVGWWKLDETSGTVAADSSDNGNAGTMQGGLNAGNDSVSGYTGKALDFDGNNDYIQIGNEANFDFERTDPFSISAWVYRESSATDDDVIAKLDAANQSRGYGLWFPSGGNSIQFDIIRNGSTSYMFVRSAADTIPLLSWTHITATYDGSSTRAGMKLYTEVSGF